MYACSWKDPGLERTTCIQRGQHKRPRQPKHAFTFTKTLYTGEGTFAPPPPPIPHPSLHFPLVALYALLSGTDGDGLAITHRVARLISVLLQVQRCQAGAVALPYTPHPPRPLILSVGVFPAVVLSSPAKCCSQPFFPPPFPPQFYLFWFRVSTQSQHRSIVPGEQLWERVKSRMRRTSTNLQTKWKVGILFEKTVLFTFIRHLSSYHSQGFNVITAIISVIFTKVTD